jgi:CBS domain-containing protein
MTTIQSKGLTKEQLDLIERYKVAYNTIDHYLRNLLKTDKTVSFSRLVNDYAARYPRWASHDQLLLLGELRNVIVHFPEKEYEYLSIPTPIAVDNIERIRDVFLSTELVTPKFQRSVTSVDTNTTLSDVLKIVNDKEYSQFPVYRDNHFVGLLTENGVTRWLANYTSRVLTLVEFDEEIVDSVLHHEEKRPNYAFISRDLTILDAENKYVANPFLEALLITNHGKQDEKLIGIISRWDILQL